MPTAPWPRCTFPGCRVRQKGGGRCPAHRPTRASARARGYDRGWDALAKRVIAEEPICRRCGVNPSTVAGHILPRSRGGTNARSNLRGLCASCNAIERDLDHGKGKG